MPKQLSADCQISIRAALLRGETKKSIAQRFGVHVNTVRRYHNKFEPDRVRATRGRPSKIPSSTQLYLKVKVLTGTLKTAKDVHKKLEELGYPVSYQSAINTLKSLGFHAAIKKKKPFLSQKHRKHRLAWAKKYQHWTVDDWRLVVFSDETKINVWGSDGCKYYWSASGDPLKPHHIELTVKHGGGSLMMWGCITAEGPGYACQVLDGTMKSEDYKYILGTTLKNSMEYYGMDWSVIYFQHDGDPKHRSKSTTEWLIKNNVNYIDDWPAQSPDLNPIEHVWHHLKLKLSMYPTRAKGVHELWERVDKEWNTITKEECQSYIDSMPARIRAVIKAKGGPTRY